jgi:hypothetical protein
MTNNNDLKNKRITIKSELPIPLGELAIYVLDKGQDESLVTELIDNNPEKVNSIMEKEVREFFEEKKLDIALKELKHEYNDSYNLTHGVAYFSAVLEGTEDELKEIAGDDKEFIFDWNEKRASRFSNINN